MLAEMLSENNLDGSGPFEADSSQLLKFQFFLCWNMVLDGKQVTSNDIIDGSGIRQTHQLIW